LSNEILLVVISSCELVDFSFKKLVRISSFNKVWSNKTTSSIARKLFNIAGYEINTS